jgi:serine/threonine protein phosphatase PrpC
MHQFLFNSQYFPLYTLQAINESYLKAEEEFKAIAFNTINNKLLDNSGSCSISILIIDDLFFVTYLGDSRALYSYDSGNQFLQISRDHKPDDNTERTRIEKAGGKVYKDTVLNINGQRVQVKEESMPGFKFPSRLSPGNIAVSSLFFIYYL